MWQYDRKSPPESRNNYWSESSRRSISPGGGPVEDSSLKSSRSRLARRDWNEHDDRVEVPLDQSSYKNGSQVYELDRFSGKTEFPGPERSSRKRSRDHSRRSKSRSRSRNRGGSRYSSSSRNESLSRKSSDRTSKSRAESSAKSRDREASESSIKIPNYMKQTPTNTVIVKNLSPKCTVEDIREEVEAFGAPIKDLKLEKDHKLNYSRDTSPSASSGAVEGRLGTWAYLLFLRLEDAQRWMEQSQGRLRIHGEWAEMVYSEPETSSLRHDTIRKTKSRRSRSRSSGRGRRRRSRSKKRSKSRSSSRPRRNRSRSRNRSRDEIAGGERNRRSVKDWDCFNCKGRNYPRRMECYRCGLSREESERSLTDLSLQQISSKPTKYLLIRELDALTSDETLQLILSRLSPVFIRQTFISRDPLLQVSNGYAYVELNSESDAEQLKNLLQAKNFTVDRKKVSIFFSKAYGDEAVRVTGLGPPMLYNEPKVSKEYPQRRENEEELRKNPLVQVPKLHQTPSVNSLPPATVPEVTQTVNVNGQLYPVFPVPNPALYVYDANSGYYYDHQTTLYYDANSRYYYNSTTQQFLYWDANYSTYLPLPEHLKSKMFDQSSASDEKTDSKVKEEPAATLLSDNRGSVSFSISGNKSLDATKKGSTDKNSMAKKVREDMERWTKSINSLKKPDTRVPPASGSATAPENSSGFGVMGSLPSDSVNNTESSDSWGQSSSSADLAFAALERRNMLDVSADKKANDPASEFKRVLLDNKPATALSALNSSAYGQPLTQQSSFAAPREEEDPKATLTSEEVRLTDWSKLACLLCKRQFKDRDTLVKHQRMSDLHKSNMEAHLKSLQSSSLNGTSSLGAPNQQQSISSTGAAEVDSLTSMLQYRDRAKERRQKHGISAPPLRDHELAICSATATQASKPEEPIGRGNVGNKLMQAMGWKEGEGLGKAKQGITAPIKASVRESTAGLGAPVYTRDPNKSYAENARHALLSRIKKDM